ncbi:MAG: hypothetical protein EXS46_01330 [Candidatus Taylorbacteria bacterium]|nr:hypothetical protein [Candidatus Taylorbacteria bacterium]
MGRNVKFTLGLIIFLLAAVSISGYAYIQSKEFRRGPQITIQEPANGTAFNNPVIHVSGIAENVSSINLNNATIFVDSEGHFNQKLLLLPGYNILTVNAEDRFGKKVQKTLELVYKEQAEKTQASSTSLTN